ncbi:IclR family transcriptional regulator [Sphingomonas sp. MMSM20]|uniref:IclR family transcriptional regulator n=1 Tax=Sphingomonas lycopersici TaxID=2951807 RepID=UPI00223845C8|nr:IclR family transcriptional regulator [Sphingomonas lycopersici]MCW6530119.1 IclR family transcriptional regulator [Sphingomonas lycopersici]
MAGKETESGAVDRALALLAALLADNGERPLAAVAADLALPLSTAHRLVAALVRHGLLIRVGQGRYAASAGLTQLGAAARSHALLARIARPALRRLAGATGMVVHLGVMRGDMVSYLVKEPIDFPLFTREGMELEAYCSGIGKLLLAHLPDEALDQYLANGPFVALTRATIIVPEAIRAHLAQVRAHDFATDAEEVVEGLGCIAVPIRDAGGAVIAALSASASPPRPVSAPVLRRLRRCAGEIERALAGVRTSPARSP